MIKSGSWIFLLPGLIYTNPTFAILLDCKKNADGTYLCVEIDGSQAITPPKSNVPDIENFHIEQAKKECTYHEPRTRMGSGSAVRSEARKAAKEDFERCVANRAWELKNQGNRSGQENIQYDAQ